MDLKRAADEIRNIRKLASSSRDRVGELADRLASRKDRLEKHLEDLGGPRRDTLVGHASDTMVGRHFPKPGH
jgi:hypothetical protein